MTSLSNGIDPQNEFRRIPAVAVLLNDPSLAGLAGRYGPRLVTDALRTVLADARRTIAAGAPAPLADAWPRLVAERLERQAQPSLRPLINATGVIIHTNLGRAPLSPAALEAISLVGKGYSNLEYDLQLGERGSRYDHARTLLQDLTGAEDALVVNNNAAAIYLVLASLCQGRQVLISRGQLVEIGGGFRIPDVLRQSGAILVEVGATNRTHLRDFAAALTHETAAIMRVHSSNFKQIGFVSMPDLSELAELVHGYGGESGAQQPILIDDLGSGALIDTARYGLASEPMVRTSLDAGADIVTLSGDKLLGGPQAGLILGRRLLVERIRRHPLARALRVDKLTLAALDATLRSYQRGRAIEEIPVWRMISAPAEELHARAAAWQAALVAGGIACQLAAGESAVGGGSLPGETMPTTLLSIAQAQPAAAAVRLRAHSPPIVGRIHQDHLVFDPRTVLPEEDDLLVAGLLDVLAGP